MIKDLMKSIFNEDIDLDEEVEEVEEVETVEPVQPVEPQPTQEPATSIEEVVSQPEQIPAMDVVQPVEPQPAPAPVQPTVQTVQQPRPYVHSESFADLSIDDINQPESDVMSRRPYKYDRKKLNRVGQRTQPEEEYSAVLSPIFGNAQDNEKDYRKVHNAVNLEKPVDDPEFVQVISPMFGNNVAGNMPVETIPTKDPSRKTKTKAPDVSVTSVVEKKEPEVVQKQLFSTKD